MNTSHLKFASVEAYIASHSPEVQPILSSIRNIIKKNAPAAAESISYGMPAYKTNGKPLVYFSAFQNHIGFYATPNGHEAFAKELAGYKQGKGSVQFPIKDPMPLKLIAEIVQFRVQQNNERTK
jgi:uncharacterized protein YdhG (YjbR/CyaY superfamily)